MRLWRTETCRPAIAHGGDEGMDGEDLLRVSTWAEKIGFAEAVRTRTALAGA